eukprot:gene10198-16602_t
MSDKVAVDASAVAAAAGGLKKVETKVANTLPTKEDIAAEKAGN